MSSAEPSAITIKNMVCPRCIRAVERILEDLGIDSIEVRLGQVTLKRPLDESQRSALSRTLLDQGFELLQSSSARVISRIKALIIQRIHHGYAENPLKLSVYLSEELGRDYSSLSRLFSSVEGITIERFSTRQHVERVKELLVYDELTIAEIAARAGYSSAAHLSSQFKRETGLTPSEFRRLREPERQHLDSI